MVIFAPGASDSFSLVPSRRAPFPPAGRSAPHLAVGVTDAAVEVLADNAGLQADGGGTVAGGPHVLGSVPLRPQGWWWAAVLDGDELGRVADLVVRDGWRRREVGFGIAELRAAVVAVTGCDPGPACR